MGSVDVDRRFAALEFSDSLDLSYLGLTSPPSVPFGLNGMDKVRSVCLEGNQLRTFPTWLSTLPNLQSLSLRSNHLTEVPDTVDFENYVGLDLSENNICELEIGHLRKVRSLNLAGNSLRKGERDVAIPEGLASLNLRSNDMSWCPKFDNANGLQALDLSRNAIDNVDSIFTDCDNLRLLDLSTNRIAKLPSAVSSLKRLERLGLAHNTIEELPVDFCDLESLRSLDVTDNKITRFCDHGRRLTELINLVAAHNKIEDCVTFLAPEAVSTLGLRGNRIRMSLRTFPQGDIYFSWIWAKTFLRVPQCLTNTKS